jgi:prepilin-type N-terminal cleavage/methylation domain-containing protein
MIRRGPSFVEQGGFSLLELAVVMTILALLLGSALLPLAAQNDMRARRDTDKALADIRDALVGFAIVNGRLPCPAAATVATGMADAGAEAHVEGGCACTTAASDVAAAAGVACAATTDEAVEKPLFERSSRPRTARKFSAPFVISMSEFGSCRRAGAAFRATRRASRRFRRVLPLPRYCAYPWCVSFSMLCTRQKSFHCVSTFFCPRKVKRSSPLL